MTPLSPSPLGRAAYLSPTPAAAFDGDGRRVAANPAYRLLFEGGDAIELRAAATVGFTEQRCVSPSFGEAQLAATEIPAFDAATGERSGSLLYLEILSLEKLTDYRRALLWQLSHHVGWEVYAASYDRVLLEQDYYREVVDRHVRALTGPGVERVLDLGAGTGNVALPLAEAGIHVTALDQSPAMLDRLREKALTGRPGSLEIVEASAEERLWPEARFDGVNVLLAFYDMSQPEAALREAIRMLRPGGVLVCTEPRRRFQMATVLEGGERHLKSKGSWERLARDWQRVSEVNDLFDPTERHAEPRNTPRLFAEDLLAQLEKEGFRKLSFEPSHFDQCATIVGLRP